MKKVLLVGSFIILVITIYIFINCFDKKEEKENNLLQYHITNISISKYDIDVSKKVASLLLQDDGLIKYYKIDLDKLENYLKIMVNVKGNITPERGCVDGDILPIIKVKHDDGSNSEITVWCDGIQKVLGEYTYDDLKNLFYDIIDMKSERTEILGKENELTSKYDITSIRLENVYFTGQYIVAYGPVYQTDITKILIGEENVYTNGKVRNDLNINFEKLDKFLSIMQKVSENIGETDYEFEGKYFIIAYRNSQKVKIVDNGSNDNIVDSYTFNDLLNMFLDIYSN